MRYDIPPEKIEEQISREEQQREAALGRRFSAASNGHLGPVISRWINASIAPVAARVKFAATAYLGGYMPEFAALLDTPLFGLAAAYDAGSPEYLEPILRWSLRGSSPGRVGDHTTYAEDLVLATLGRTISDLALRSLHRNGDDLLVGGVEGLPLAGVLASAASVTRETALGQFITFAQGAAAVGAVRKRDQMSWRQRKKLNKIGAVLSSQVRHALTSEAQGEISLEHFGARTIVQVIDPKYMEQGPRRVSIRADNLQDDDWSLLGLAMSPKGEEDSARNAWLSFSMMILCASQVEHGWFDLFSELTPRHSKMRRPKGRTRYLTLAEKPKSHLKQDLAKWIGMGFTYDPMVVPPSDGTYLTTKIRKVTGSNGPHGWRTKAEGSTAWEAAADVMAATPWCVARHTLNDIYEGGSALTELAHMAVPDELARRLILGAYRKDSFQEEIYLPVYMDFRGRIYTRTSWVTYQGNDLQKGLLHFPKGVATPDEDALALHVTALMGFDKVALPERRRIFAGLEPKRDTMKADEPIQLWTALDLIGRGMGDSVPIQIDGTCNGLQHLSALFRDHEAAPWVNIAAASYNEPPNDLYAEVAGHTAAVVALEAASGAGWAMRLLSSGATIGRSVCKRPVMVLPYGGTSVAIEAGVSDGILEQNGVRGDLWFKCLKAEGIVDSEAIAGNYLAFTGRALGEHPLFRRDMQKLGQIVYGAIKRTIPKAIEAMEAFRAIAGVVGDRSLEWSNAVGDHPMWIVHAYAKSSQRTSNFRGFHLPNSVRGLAMLCGKDEVSGPAHRAGIVANFIHSQDAAHLAETMIAFRDLGGQAFAANHDCLFTRSSESKIAGAAVRSAFGKRYLEDPLRSPVRIRSMVKGREVVDNFETWYEMADYCGVAFPEMGRWKPEEVMRSAWFFS